MKAAVSVDHRASNGDDSLPVGWTAKFMQALAVYLEEPLRMVVNGL